MGRMLPVPLVPGWFGFPFGALVGVVVTLVVLVAGATAHPELSLVAMVIVVDIVAMMTTVVATLGTMVVCWCLHSGFVLGRYGELALTPRSGHDALVLGLVTLGALGFASLVRAARSQRDTALRSIPLPRSGAEPAILIRR
jgi:hypothetical protein